MHLLPGGRSQREAAPSVSLRHCQRKWPLVAVPSGHTTTCRDGHNLWTVFTAPVCSSLALWVSGIGTKPLNSLLYFMAKKKKEDDDKRCVSCCHKSTKGEMLFKLAIGQNLQNEGRASFLPIYLYYICTDFFLNLK